MKSEVIINNDKNNDKNIDKSIDCSFNSHNTTITEDTIVKEDTTIKKDNIIFDILDNNLQSNFHVNDYDQVITIYRSIKQNYIFYITILLCIYIFTQCSHNKSNLIYGIGTMIFITFYGYAIHYLSHFMEDYISKIYKSYDNIFTRNKYFNWFAEELIYFGEFHAVIHHNTSINKTYKNIALEFINNFITQGCVIIAIKYAMIFLDNRVILLWALYYATVHNINYNITHPLTHQQHHINSRTNYGIDIWDIIIGSKYDWSEVETHNHTAINLIVITAVIYYVCNKFKI